MKQNISLGEIQETLLIPLYGRAVETQRARGLLYDPGAVEIVQSIDYDFSKFDGKPSLPGSCLRTLAFDRWVQRFLEEHPRGTVVELGVGLNSRYERLDNGQAQWIELDLPDTIALRSQFFENTSNRQLLAASAADPAWVEVVKQTPGPHFFCSEAVLIYLQPEQVRQVFGLIADHFPGSKLAFDSMSKLMKQNQRRHDVMKNMSASFSWALEQPAEIESWRPGYRLLESFPMMELMQEYSWRVPRAMMLFYQLMRWLYPPFVRAYCLNLVELA